jgi:hypothetical protein
MGTRLRCCLCNSRNLREGSGGLYSSLQSQHCMEPCGRPGKRVKKGVTLQHLETTAICKDGLREESTTTCRQLPLIGSHANMLTWPLLSMALLFFFHLHLASETILSNATHDGVYIVYLQLSHQPYSCIYPKSCLRRR